MERTIITQLVAHLKEVPVILNQQETWKEKLSGNTANVSNKSKTKGKNTTFTRKTSEKQLVVARKDSVIEMRLVTDALSQIDRIISLEDRLLKQPSPNPSQMAISNRPHPIKELFDTDKPEFKNSFKSTQQSKPTESHFQAISPDKGILRGTKHINEFVDGNALNLPACILATLMQMNKDSSLWDPQMLDEILDKASEITSDSKNDADGDKALAYFGIVQIGNREFAIGTSETAAVGQLGSRKRDVLDLFRAVTDFFASNDCGVIQGPNTVALWHEGSLYYMYDPYECDHRGDRIVRTNNEPADITLQAHTQNKSSLSHASEKGSSCLTWFSSPRDLAKAYVNNVAPDKRKSNFFIMTVKISEHDDMPEDWYNWKAISKNSWLLRGSYSQASSRFSEETRNLQSMCNAAVAITFTKLTETKRWTKLTVNEILQRGDDFYKKCIRNLNEHHKIHGDNLKPEDLMTEYFMNDAQVSYDIQENMIGGLITADEKDKIYVDLREGIQEFFKENVAGVVTARNFSIAVWKDSSGAYYYFDPFPRDEHGRQKDGGTACVLRSLDQETLINALEAILPVSRNDMYNISGMRIKLWPLPEKKTVNSPPENFTSVAYEMMDKCGILRCDFHEGNSRFEERRNKQTICNIAQAMAYSTLFPSSGWNAEILNNILISGDRLFNEILSRYGGHFEVTLDNFESTIKIGSNILKLSLGLEYETVFLNHENIFGDKFNVNGSLPNILERFFETEETDEGKYAFLVSDVLIVGLWQQGKSFFMFDPKACDTIGMPSGRRLKETRRKIRNSSKEISVEEDENNHHSACLLWFDGAINLLIKILLSIPVERLEDESVRIAQVRFTNRLSSSTLDTMTSPSSLIGAGVDTEAPSIVKWNNFQETERGVYILHASISQNNLIFEELPNRDNQDVGNAISAIVFASCHSCARWNTDTLDVMLKFGDRLYKSTYDKRKDIEDYTIGPWRHKIRPKHIAKRFLISDYKINLIFHDEILRGNLKTTDDNIEVPNLRRALIRFFDRLGGFYAVLTCKRYSVSLWMDSEGTFYLFDPHECGPSGRYRPNGKACCVRSKDLGKLIKIFTNNACAYADYKGAYVGNDFSIQGVIVKAEECLGVKENLNGDIADTRDLGNMSRFDAKRHPDSANNDRRILSINDENGRVIRRVDKDTFRKNEENLREPDNKSIKSIQSSAKSRKFRPGKKLNKTISNTTSKSSVKTDKRAVKGKTSKGKMKPLDVYTVNAPLTPDSETMKILNRKKLKDFLFAIKDDADKDSLTTKIKRGDMIFSENLETILPPSQNLIRVVNVRDLGAPVLPIEKPVINAIELHPLQLQNELALQPVPKFRAWKDTIEMGQSSQSSATSINYRNPNNAMTDKSKQEGQFNNIVLPPSSQQIVKPSETQSQQASGSTTHEVEQASCPIEMHNIAGLSSSSQVPVPQAFYIPMSDSEHLDSLTVKGLNTARSDHQETSDYQKLNEQSRSIASQSTNGEQISSHNDTEQPPSPPAIMGRNFSVLRGYTALTNAVSQGYIQPAPYIAVAIALAQLQDSSTWTPNDIDDINDGGETLLTAALENLSTSFDALKERLHITDLPPVFLLKDQEARMIVKTAFARGRIDEDLRECLKRFLQQHDYGVLNTPALVLGVWKQKNVFYSFNCLPCDAAGNLKLGGSEGASCLMSFERLRDLCDVIIANLRMEEREYAFSIRPLEIKVTDPNKELVELMKPEHEPITATLLMYVKSIRRAPPGSAGVGRFGGGAGGGVWKDHTSTRAAGFVPYCEGGDILRTSTSHLAHEHKILPVCIAAVVTAAVRNPGRWNETVLNKVIIMGRKLYRERPQFFDDRNQEIEEMPKNSSLKACKVDSRTVDVEVIATIEAGYLFIEELLRAFESFFRKEHAGIFWAGVKFVLMEMQNSYYCFDAVSGCNPYVMRFSNLHHLTGFVYAKCLKDSDPAAALRRFHISSVRISDS